MKIESNNPPIEGQEIPDDQGNLGGAHNGRNIDGIEAENYMNLGASGGAGSISISDRTIANQAQVSIKMSEAKYLHNISASRYLQDAVDFTYYLNDRNFLVHGFDSVNFHIYENGESCVLSFFVNDVNRPALDNFIEKIRGKEGHKEETFIFRNERRHQSSMHQRVKPDDSHTHKKIDFDNMSAEDLKNMVTELFEMAKIPEKEAVNFVELMHFFAQSPEEPGVLYDDGTYAERGGSRDINDSQGNSETTLEHVLNGPYQLKGKLG